MALNLNTLLLADAFNNIFSKLRIVKNQTQATVARIDAGATADEVINIMRGLQTSYDIINTAKTTPGLAQYAKDQLGDAALDIAAEVNATLAAMASAVTWITNNFPKDANGYILKDKILNGALDVRAFTPAQMAGLKTQLNAILATFA